MIEAQVLLENCSSQRDAWLKLRKIGSSDASAIVGLNPYRTKYKAWLELSGLLPPDPENEAMYWGTRLEEVVASEFMRRTGWPVMACDRLYAHQTRPWMTCTPDRLMCDADNVTGILECKTGSSHAHDWSTGVNDHSHVQVQHQLAVTGLPYAYIAVLQDGRNFYYYRIDRDEEIIQQLVEVEEQFWKQVQEGVPPALRSDDSALLTKLYPVSHDYELMLPPEGQEAAKKWGFYREIERTAVTEKERQEVILKSLLRDASTGLTDEFKVSWKSFSRTGWDTKRLEKEMPELAAEYKQALPMRRFEVKKLKKEKSDGEI